MRGIKFRAWDGKVMHEDVVVYMGQAFLEKDSLDCNAIHITKVLDHIEQFTGLTDKNGVDVYEGDILTDHIGKGVVEYKERYAAFRIKYGKPNAGRGKWFLDYNLRGERESLEVIGNIHQNSELL